MYTYHQVIGLMQWWGGKMSEYALFEPLLQKCERVTIMKEDGKYLVDGFIRKSHGGTQFFCTEGDTITQALNLAMEDVMQIR